MTEVRWCPFCGMPYHMLLPWFEGDDYVGYPETIIEEGDVQTFQVIHPRYMNT